MAFRWSTAQLVAEHKTLQATSLALSNDSVHCALTSKREISIVNLDSPNAIAKKIRRTTQKWETTASEWNPIDKKQLAITDAQMVQIYYLDANCNFNDSTTSSDKTSSPSFFNQSSDGNPLILRGHTRTITDLNWAPYDVDLLVTASYDNQVNVWDIRDPRRPTISMSSVVGASQVKWSKVNEYVLASCHEGDVRIWDTRKSNTPTHYITAHLSKIYGLDWNPSPASKSSFATCSQDGTVRFWDLNTFKGKSENQLNTNLPVWRSRYTPFGHGLLTALVPQLRRSGENNSLWLWSLDCFLQPLHAFVGHLDVVLEFAWRLKSGDDYELVTWSKDNSLRIWKVDNQLLQDNNLGANDFADDFSELASVKSEKEPIDQDMGVSRPMTLELPNQAKDLKPEVLTPEIESKFKPETPVIPKPATLHEEFSIVNESFSIPNIKIEELNADKRFCIVSATTTTACRIKITFPQGYPNQVLPSFTFINTSLTDDDQRQLINALQSNAALYVKHNKRCLDVCLRQFISTLEKLTGTTYTSTPQLDLFHHHNYGSFLDASVPFPRTSGARFCASDILVCFGRPPHLEQINAPMEFTPRSLSALSGYLLTHYRTSNINNSVSKAGSTTSSVIGQNDMPSISSFYFKAKRRNRHKSRGHTLNAEKGSKSHSSPNCGPVFVFTVSGLLPISRQLAEMYVFNNGDPVKMCEINAKIASKLGRRDLNQKWTLVKLSAEAFVKSISDSNNMMESPWSMNPLGRKMIHSLIDHSVSKCGDIQTAAMISCVFDYQEHRESFKSKTNIKSLNNLTPINGPSATSNNLPGNSPYHTVGPAQPTTPNNADLSDEWSYISAVETLKRTRSNSWSDFAENDLLIYNSAKADAGFAFPDPSEVDLHQNKIRMLDPNYQHLYDWYKLIYSDILFRWRLLEERAMVLKCVSPANVNHDLLFHTGIDFVTECRNSLCDKNESVVRTPLCRRCQKPTLVCAVCRLRVLGATNHCFKCGHGGHALHLHQWFSTYDFCPTGCGCRCLGQKNPFE